VSCSCYNICLKTIANYLCWCTYFCYVRFYSNINEPKICWQSSIERKRMSKRLVEDAKAYFDECVSLSTFDSSDFSSQEDPPLSMVGPPTPSRLTEASSNASSVFNLLSTSCYSFLA
jgi:hypothetical protein